MTKDQPSTSIARMHRLEPWPRLSDWMEALMPANTLWHDSGLHSMRVEETLTDDALVIRAELPGMDPEKDIEVTVSDGLLTIEAHREQRTETEHRSELFYGTFMRTLALPAQADEGQVKAEYRDGMLEVTVALRREEQPTPAKVPISRPES